MITRFLEAGHHAPWVAGDEVYGGNPKLRAALEERGTGYVLAVACSHESSQARGSSARTHWRRRCPSGAGRSCPPGPAPRGTASTTGRHRPDRLPARQSPVADPPQPQHRRTRLLPLLLGYTRAARRVGASRWIVMAGRGVLPSWQGPGRTGRKPGPPLHVLVPLGHPGHARACLPRRCPRVRTRPPPRNRRPHTAHLQ